MAHFVGMHALQVLPLVSFYFIRNPTTIVPGLLYGLFALCTLAMALREKSMLGRFRKENSLTWIQKAK